MYAISGTSPQEETTYWNGGDIFSVYPEDAVRFVKEVDAEATISILQRAWGNSEPYAVVKLPGGIDA